MPTDMAVSVGQHLRLSLNITDPEVVQALLQHPDGVQRERHALLALRMGVLALRHLTGSIDAEAIRSASDKVISDIELKLRAYASDTKGEVAKTLERYLDPKTGEFHRRVRDFLKEEGELERTFEKQLHGNNSPLAEMLNRHVGADSPILKHLRPDTNESVIGNIQTSVENLLKGIKDDILGQFTLDNPDGAIRRFKEEVEKQIKELADNQNKYLAKLNLVVGAEEGAKKEREQGTGHGIDFEHAVFDEVSALLNGSGDLVEHVANKPGLLKNRVVGDVVITMSEESANPGAKIVVEAKEDESYGRKEALDELALCRKNRDASVGVFIMSARSAEEGKKSKDWDRLLSRHNSDLLVVWHPDREHHDIVLQAALSLARGLAVRKQADSEHVDVDWNVVNRALLDIETQIDRYDELLKQCDKIDGAVETIRNELRTIGKKLRTNAVSIDKQIAALRQNDSPPAAEA